MGVTGDTFNEGYKYMCAPLQLIDAATGESLWINKERSDRGKEKAALCYIYLHEHHINIV